MSIAAIPPLSIAPTDVAPQTFDVRTAMRASSDTVGNTVFEKLLSHLDGVNTQLINTDKAVQQLANGETENLHQVMISLEQTRLAFDLLLQVRNKVLDAYQEVMKMQV